MKKIAAIAALVAATALAVAPIGSAAKPADPVTGGKCVAAGVGTLVSLGLIDEAARGEIDYSTLADAENGPIYTDLPEGSFLPLRAVIDLHRTDPDLFEWCRGL